MNGSQSVYLNVVGTIRDLLPEHLRRWDVDDHGCWIWQGHKHPNGWAGATSYVREGTPSRKGSAYRCIWEIVNGREVAPGLEMDHVCGRGRFGCVNPFHIVESDHKTNIYRSVDAPTMVNARKTHCVNGHELTPENVIPQSEKAGGGRACKTCARKRALESSRKNRAEYNRRAREKYAADPRVREMANERRRRRRAKQKARGEKVV